MAIDPNLAPASSETGPISIIENEIPAYRAISSGAVFSLILGVASILCFTSLWFLILALGSIGVGVLAIRSIARRSDVLTGANLARVGITLGLVCGVASATSTFVQSFLMNREASRFATDFVEVLKDKPLAVALYLHQPPRYRNTKTPDEIAAEVKESSKPGPGGDPYTEQTAPILAIKEILKDKKGEVHFEKIETAAFQGLTSYANALIEIHDNSSKEPIDTFALLNLRKDPQDGPGEWTIEKLIYPYTPRSFVFAPKATDDGHGHSH